MKCKRILHLIQYIKDEKSLFDGFFRHLCINIIRAFPGCKICQAPENKILNQLCSVEIPQCKLLILRQNVFSAFFYVFYDV
jgi:hypothetical protein